MDATPDDDTGLVDADEAAALIGVERSRVDVMVEEGLLTVAGEAGGAPLFHRAEAEAVRLAGG